MEKLGKLLTGFPTGLSGLKGRTSLLVLQSTPFCNVDCEYCYLPDRNNRVRMSLETVGAAVNWLYRAGLAAQDLTIVWHSGEPLVPPVGWYEQAFAACKSAAPASAGIRHALQTNATLIDDDWCRLFLEHAVKVGVSVDGPAWIHDLHRKDRRGRGTHETVMRGVRALTNNRVPFHAICVVTEAALNAADAIMDFFESIGVSEVGFNVDEQEGARLHSSLCGRDLGARYRAFLDRVIERAERPNAPAVREFSDVLGALLDPSFGLATSNVENEPFRIVTVLADGRISTFSPEIAGTQHERLGELTFGNVRSDSLPDILASPKFLSCAAEITAGIESCRANCQYFRLCGGGAPANKLAELGAFGGTETQHCRLSRQAVVDAALTHIRTSLKATAESLPQSYRTPRADAHQGWIR